MPRAGSSSRALSRSRSARSEQRGERLDEAGQLVGPAREVQLAHGPGGGREVPASTAAPRRNRGPRRAARTCSRTDSSTSGTGERLPQAGVDQARLGAVAGGEKAVLGEHLRQVDRRVRARALGRLQPHRHCTSAVSAAESATVVWASMIRTSIVPKRGCRRTSHHRNVGSGNASQRSSRSIVRT